MAKEIGALRYFECSAKEEIGVGAIFQFAAKHAIKSKSKRQRDNCKLF